MVSYSKKFNNVVIGSYHYLILQILENENKSLTMQEILKKLNKKTKLGGKRPSNTISTILYRSRYVQKIGKKYRLSNLL